MKLLLLRHGHDLAGPDGESVLSRQGREQVATSIDQARELGILGFDLALCAESLRARQSLDVAAQRVSLARSLLCAAIHPDAAAERLLEALYANRPDVTIPTVLVVGHEPQLTHVMFALSAAPSPPPEERRDLLSRGEGALTTLRFDSRGSPRAEEWSFLGERHALGQGLVAAQPRRLFS